MRLKALSDKLLAIENKPWTLKGTTGTLRRIKGGTEMNSAYIEIRREGIAEPLIMNIEKETPGHIYLFSYLFGQEIKLRLSIAEIMEALKLNSPKLFADAV